MESFNYKLITQKHEYIDGQHKCKIECNNGHVYKASMHDFNIGNRCPTCRKSKGEEEVKRVLSKNNTRFIEQYKFEKCRLRRTLPFDFYLPDYNVCIEYDGRQHFEVVKAFGGLDNFIDTKIRDTIKNEYCKNNNIKLIRIPYWDFDNIETILIEKIKL